MNSNNCTIIEIVADFIFFVVIGSNEEIKKLNSQIIKLFQPLSLRKTNIGCYITIDTAQIINLFAEKGTKGKLLQSLKENQKEEEKGKMK